MDTNTHLAGIGDNKPPVPLDLDPDIISDQWEVDHARHLTPARAVVDSIARFTAVTKDGITTPEMAEKATDFALQAKKQAALLDGIRRICKSPYEAVASRADAMFNGKLITPLRAAARLAEDRLTSYQQAEARRRWVEAAAEAARLAEDARRLTAAADAAGGTGDIAELATQVTEQAKVAERQATASVTEMSRTRGSRGSLASVRPRRDFRVVKLADVPREWLMLDESKVRREMNAANSTLTDIPGIEFFDASRTVVTGH